MRAIFFACLLTFSSYVFADIIIPNTHHVDKCIKIVNIYSFPDIAIIGNFKFYGSEFYYDSIQNNVCIEPKGYDFYSLLVYAVNRSVINGSELSSFDLSSDKRFVPWVNDLYPEDGYFNDSLPYKSITEEYRIVGFSGYMVYMYKHKEIIGFNNGQPDSVSYFTYDKDSSELLPSIPTGIVNQKEKLGLEFYPNPANDVLNIQIENPYQGIIVSKLYAQNGQVVLSRQEHKLQEQFNSTLNTSELTQGIYYLELSVGDNSYTEKIVIK